MSQLKQYLIRIMYALESLEEENQLEIVEYIERVIAEIATNEEVKLNLFLKEGSDYGKKIN